jgi:hypothetical protein
MCDYKDTYNCLMGNQHNWVKTGKGFFTWASANIEPVPSDAQFTAEEQCMICNAIRYVSPTPDKELT